MMIYVVTGAQMDYGDSGDVIVGVFDDPHLANEASKAALAAFDSTQIHPIGLNSVTIDAAKLIGHYRRYIYHKEAAS